MFDIVIKNAQVFDGSCNPWYYSDICIKKGRIEKTGKVFTGEKASSPYKPLSPPGRGKARGKKQEKNIASSGRT